MEAGFRNGVAEEAEKVNDAVVRDVRRLLLLLKLFSEERPPFAFGSWGG